MSVHAIVPPFGHQGAMEPGRALDHAPQSNGRQLRSSLPRAKKGTQAATPFHFTAQFPIEEGAYHQAELFYLQKQIQSQTPMVIVLEGDERVEGCVEWYDRNCLKIRGRNKTLVYKSAIKYMYKLGELGQ